MTRLVFGSSFLFLFCVVNLVQPPLAFSADSTLQDQELVRLKTELEFSQAQLTKKAKQVESLTEQLEALRGEYEKDKQQLRFELEKAREQITQLEKEKRGESKPKESMPKEEAGVTKDATPKEDTALYKTIEKVVKADVGFTSGFTAEKARMVKSGMTKEQVADILGGNGVDSNDSVVARMYVDPDGVRAWQKIGVTETRLWAHLTGYLVLGFRNGKVLCGQYMEERKTVWRIWP